MGGTEDESYFGERGVAARGGIEWWTSHHWHLQVSGKWQRASTTLESRWRPPGGLTVHGGPYKAVYGYPIEHYSKWRGELPELEFPMGAFGENLTVEGLDETTLHIGDRLRIGTSVLVVTQPRMPCYKLGIRFQRDDMIKRFLASGRSGFYFSVEEEGEVSPGSGIEILSRDPHEVRVADIQLLYLHRNKDATLLDRAVQVDALPDSWRTWLIERAEGTRSRSG